MAALQRHPRNLFGLAAGGFSAAVSYTVYHLLGARVDPEVLTQVENLIAELPTRTLPLEDVIPPSISALVEYYTPDVVKNAVSSNLLADHDWCLYALTGLVVWSTCSSVLASVACKATAAANHEKDEGNWKLEALYMIATDVDIEIASLRKHHEAELQAKDAIQRNRLEEKYGIISGLYESLSLSETQQAEDAKAIEGLKQELLAAGAKGAADEEHIQKLAEELGVARAFDQEDKIIIREKAATIVKNNQENLKLAQANTELVSANAALKTQVDALEAGCNQKSVTIRKMWQDNTVLTDTVTGLESRVSSLEAEKKQQTVTNAETQHHNGELENTNRRLQSQIATLRKDKSSTEAAIQASQRTIDGQTGMIADLQQKEGRDKCTIQTLKDDLQNLGESKASIEVSLTKANSRCTSLTEEVKKLNAAKSKGDYEALEKKYKDLQANGDKHLRAEHESTTKDLKGQINNLEATVRKNDDTMLAQRGTLREKNAEIKQRNNTIADLQDVNAALRRDLNQTTTTIEDSQAHISVLQSDLAAANAARDEATAKTNTLSNDEQRRTAARKFGSLKADLEANATDGLKENLRTKDRQIQALKANEASLQEQLISRTSEYEALQQSNGQLVARVKDLEEMTGQPNAADSPVSYFPSTPCVPKTALLLQLGALLTVWDIAGETDSGSKKFEALEKLDSQEASGSKIR
ncbi:MAG: hypothetical protein L6R40_002609 [Gallowayella cf. fulva]|nr:MAG: hypothetical protein L6R40_002609 [Xanthomendoza cf. fulva]